MVSAGTGVKTDIAHIASYQMHQDRLEVVISVQSKTNSSDHELATNDQTQLPIGLHKFELEGSCRFVLHSGIVQNTGPSHQ